jgi:hypothetical protein
MKTHELLIHIKEIDMPNYRDYGIDYNDEDGIRGPFMIRIGGTSEFVTEINEDYKLAWPPGLVETEPGWTNPKALKYETMEEALTAAMSVWEIEGCHTSIEKIV